MLLVMILLTFSVTVRANDVVSIQKGEVAPFSGILFSENKAQETRRELLELDKARLMVKSRDERLDILQTRIELKSEEVELYRNQNDRLIRQNESNKSIGNVERMVWVGLGVLATVGAVYAAGSLK